MIPFNVPLVSGREEKYIKEVLKNNKLSGDGPFTSKCHQWLKQKLNCQEAFLTPSGTAALEMTAILAGIKPGDDVIMPSFTFVSTANAFVLRGARIVFVDIRPDTMNIDETLIEKAITDKTRAIVPVHYAGISCEMGEINKIAKRNNLLVIEDAAQGINSKYGDKFLGSMGDLSCLSFHETKNITCGEGGALIINNKKFVEKAEIIREKGTNRYKFNRGEVNKYIWVDIGSSFLTSELNAAYLFAQLEIVNKVNEDRIKSWELYFKYLKDLADKRVIDLPVIPDNCYPNGHLFYIKVKNKNERTRLIKFLKNNGISTVFHYIPLHSSTAGRNYSTFQGEDHWTTKESERLLRLPLWYGLKKKQISYVCDCIFKFYSRD